MSRVASQPGKPHRILSVYVPAIAAMVMAVGMIYQICAPSTPQIISDPSIIEENRRLVEEKQQLEAEKATLETKLKELEEQIARVSRTEDSQLVETQPDTDHWVVTVLKTPVVYITLAVSPILTVLTFVGDLVGLAFGRSFCLTKALWGFAWTKVTMGWYWEQARWYGVALGILLVASGTKSSESSTVRRKLRRGHRYVWRVRRKR